MRLWDTKNDKVWLRHYEALCQYYQQYGNCNVPSLFIYKCELPNMGDDGGIYHYTGNLGAWLQTQRESKKHNELLAEREAKFQTLVDEGNYYQNYDI